jgi:6,7-dimethyl-8-ribityllumazine synthase
MAGKGQRPAETGHLEGASSLGAHLLVIEAPYYKAISEELAAGAIAELEARRATYERIAVPGALEIPQALAQAVKAGVIGSDDANARFDGCVALGCVIRGETTHYDYVCGESARGLMDLSVRERLAIGYGIVTVDTMEQAKARAFTDRGDKGGDAAHACLAMVALGRRWRNA